jgi:hypothetical protein
MVDQHWKGHDNSLINCGINLYVQIVNMVVVVIVITCAFVKKHLIVPHTCADFEVHCMSLDIHNIKFAEN